MSGCGYEKEPSLLPIDCNPPCAGQLQPAGTHTHTGRQPHTQPNDHPQPVQHTHTQPKLNPLAHAHSGHQPNAKPNPSGVQRTQYTAALKLDRNQLLERRVGIQAGRMARRKCQ